MAILIKLAEVVPPDIEVEAVDGEKYVIPGDLDTETTFRMLDLWQRALAADDPDGDEDDKEKRAVHTEFGEFLLDVLRIRQPDLETLPFGHVATQHVAVAVLSALGLVVLHDDEQEADPTVGQPKAKTPARSRRSSGSPAGRKRT